MRLTMPLNWVGRNCRSGNKRRQLDGEIEREMATKWRAIKRYCIQFVAGARIGVTKCKLTLIGSGIIYRFLILATFSRSVCGAAKMISSRRTR
jgi:hypothetical protein